MQHAALKLIVDEHKALACVLRALREAVANLAKSDARPDFEHLRAMLFYMDEVPARLHHAAEERALFPKIGERCPALLPVLERLRTEHARGETSVQDLQRALTAWQLIGDERRETFELALRIFIDEYLGHMEVEENYVLPVALEYLSETDWDHLYEALTDQRGPVAAQMVSGHRALLRRILEASPAVPPEGD